MSKGSNIKFTPRRNTSLNDRFNEKIKKTSGCWEWLGSLDQSGYGMFFLNGKTLRSHRVSWLLFVGLIPDGMQILHGCDNRKCVNPDHLFIGTNSDNVADKVSKCRQAHGDKLYKISDNTIKKIISEIKTKSIRQVARENGISHTAIRYRIKKIKGQLKCQTV